MAKYTSLVTFTKHRRVFYLPAAMLFTALGLFMLYGGERRPFEYTTTGYYQSRLLSESRFLDSLKEVGGSRRFRNLVPGVEIRIEPSGSDGVKISTSSPRLEGLSESHQRTVTFLSTELRTLARQRYPQRWSGGAHIPGLIQDGDLSQSKGRSDLYGLSLACWVLALSSLLMGLFAPSIESEKRPPEVDLPDSSSMGSPTEKAVDFPRIEVEGFVPLNLGRQDRSDDFLQSIWAEIEHAMHRTPSKILVLGDYPVEARLTFSLRLANHIGREGQKVRLIDFDLQNKGLSTRLGRANVPGLSELLLHGGPVDEYFSSLAGTPIQFAPAGCLGSVPGELSPRKLDTIMRALRNDITVIDASSASPLHLVVRQVDAVLCTTRRERGKRRSAREQEVLVAFRDAGLPVWGVSVEAFQFYPLL